MQPIAPSEPAPAPIPHAAELFQGRPAGLVSRVLAAVVDVAAVAAVVGVLYLGVTGVRFVLFPARFTFPEPSVWLSVPLILAIAVAYLTEGWVSNGRSWGDALLGVRVVTSYSRRPPRVIRSLVRAVLCVAFPIGLLWVPLSRRNRSVQDVLVGTSVVYDWTTRPV